MSPVRMFRSVRTCIMSLIAWAAWLLASTTVEVLTSTPTLRIARSGVAVTSPRPVTQMPPCPPGPYCGVMEAGLPLGCAPIGEYEVLRDTGAPAVSLLDKLGADKSRPDVLTPGELEAKPAGPPSGPPAPALETIP